ncbi:two-component system, sporulation sensor kinase E [Paenibacillus castaneae]|uniref:ATP-binding protein n=1 Tax=Paenibacillus castaneae TaxID=474957 RepID=UPI00141B91CE|nr:ATP-binding protein [Paenibacillus castaneae]NIK79106.1 two-component system, sporulation sensor kinase E [Paenibacillus castaneae]
MSIKAKLSFSISIIVTVVLALSIIIYYFTTKSELESQVVEQVHNIANQIGITLESSEAAVQSMEDTIGEKLRTAALSAKLQLDPDINNVKNEQLVELSQQLGVDYISLWVRVGDDVVVRKSSEPSEINASSMTWDYWHTAFLQLFETHNVTIDKGQKLENFWSGPYNFADTAPEKIRKWGYYYDGTTNYIINPFVNAQMLLDFKESTGTSKLIHKIIADQKNVLEITGFDPKFFGKSPIIKIKKGMPVYNLDVRDIPFGVYTYKDKENDSLHIQEAQSSGTTVTALSTVNGKKLIKTFIPIAVKENYVICITFDYAAVSGPLNQQLFLQAMISLGLILVTMLLSYLIAEFMLRGLNQIFKKVNAIAEGNFGETITIRSKDELGLLASRVDTMGHNLYNYTTKLKDAAEELRSTKQYLESFVNHTSDAIHVANLSGSIIQVNRAFEKMYGWTTEEAIGHPLNNVPDDYQQSQNELEAIVLSGGSVTDFETVRYTKAGTLIDLSLTISPIRDEQEAIIAIACISRNITSRKQTEEMIRRSEKLSVVGQIAAGVAHEVRNPLTTLRGFVQLQKQSGSLSPGHLDLMLAELDQINMIVSEFLIFAKPQANHYQPVNVKTILKDMMLLLESEAKMNNVKLVMQADADLPLVMGEANQLKQVFVNIMKNGIEAMTSGGKLTVELKRYTNQTVILRFTDHGGGIAEEDLLRLGEPFFTKKVNGNGLGLMVSQQIITGHKGTIQFRSEVGKGTCVEITLPTSS